MADFDDVCVLLPTMNEAETVGTVVSEFIEEGLDDVLVIDGGSDDGTRRLADEAGARVVVQSEAGKGQAVREAVTDHIDAEYVLMSDADATYDAHDADRMLEPLLADDADHVIGNRFADMRPGAMSRLNKVGNRIINAAFRTIHGANYRDILSGYRAFTRESVAEMHLTAEGFGIETEMAVECAKSNLDVEMVPITYYPRPSGSDTNLNPVRDGGVIFIELYRKAKTSNPLFYFGSIGVTSTTAGLAVAAYVLYEWIAFGIGHQILSMVSAAGILLGIQLLMFGMLADMILMLHRERSQQLDRLHENDEE